MWITLPARPKLASALEMRLRNLRVILPHRARYEAGLLRSLGEEENEAEVGLTQ